MAEDNSTGRGRRGASGGGASHQPQTNPSEQRGNAPSGQALMFVDSTADPARSREAIRVHVMRESHRVRRLQQGQSEPSLNVGQLHIWNAGGSHNDDDPRGSSPGHQSHESNRSTRPLEAPGEPTAGPSTSTSRLPATLHATGVPSAEVPGYQRQSGNLPTLSTVGELEPSAETPAENVEALVGFCMWTLAFPLPRHPSTPFLVHKRRMSLGCMPWCGYRPATANRVTRS